MSSRLTMSMLVASASAIALTAVLSAPALAQSHQNTQQHHGTQPQRAMQPHEALPHQGTPPHQATGDSRDPNRGTTPSHTADQQGSGSHQAPQPQRSMQPQAINQQATPPHQVTQPHQTDNKGGGPKINTGVSGGNTTASTVPGAGPTHSGTYTAPQQPAQPTAPAGTLYDPKSARPGTTVPGSEGKTVTPGDFSRDKQIRELTDPKGALPAPSSNPLTDRTNANPLDGLPVGGPERGAGRNLVSKEGAISDQPAPSQSAKPLGPITQGEARRQDLAAERYKFYHSNDGAERPPPSDELTLSGILARAQRPLVDEAEKFKPSVPAVAGTRGTPNPETDTGDGHGLKNMIGTNGPRKTPAQIEAERKGQVTQPNETGGPPDRMHMDKAANQNLSGRQGNLINPERGDGTTTSLGAGPLPGSDPRNPNNPTGSSMGGSKPPLGDPKETCAANSNKSC